MRRLAVRFLLISLFPLFAAAQYRIDIWSDKSETGGIEDLTPTERIVLRLIAEYKTSKEIADELCISYRTVENHRYNICQKLDVSGSNALVKFALKHQNEI